MIGTTRPEFKVTTLNIEPIKTESDCEVALSKIQRHWEAPHGSPEWDKLDVLVTLVEAYEQQHYPIPPADPVETILHHMESQGMSRRELEPYLGSRSCVLEVLNRQRALTLDMIRKLHAGLGITADILVQPYQLQTARQTTS